MQAAAPTSLPVQTDPSAAGFDPARLGRIETHLRRLVEDGRLPGYQAVVARHGRVVHYITSNPPYGADTIFRIYSMTKPVASLALMQLWEEGRFSLLAPVSDFLPAFKDQHVLVGEDRVPVKQPAQVWHLLTHTAGLSYGFLPDDPIDALYREAQARLGPDADLAAACDAWATLPLRFEPGTRWSYSVATDVVGRLVEVISGLTLDEYLRTRVFDPLRMPDTGFHVPAEAETRVADLYSRTEAGDLEPVPGARERALQRPARLSGGGGLLSTTSDYLRFAEMLRRRGELDGERLLGSRTVDFMASNHLPPGVGPELSGRSYEGVGFGLGFGIGVEPALTHSMGGRGNFWWGGAASTTFWVDPVEDLTAVFMTQVLNERFPRASFKDLVYQALVD